MKPRHLYMPLIFALLLAAGVFIGINLPNNSIKSSSSASGKLTDILNLIEQEYVDTVSRRKLTEKAIVSLLENLDPHSAYIPQEELEQVNAPLEGNFEGIGIEF